MRRLLPGYVAVALAFALPWPALPPLVGFAPVLAALLALPLAAVWLQRSWSESQSRSGEAAPSPSRGWCGVLLGALLALAWSGSAHLRALETRLQADSDGAVALTVLVASDPESLQTGPGRPPAARFQALVGSAVDSAALVGRRLRLTWYGSPVLPELRRGQRWQVQAVVKRPWSYANPGGFDYERWLLGSRVHGTGWIRQGALLAPAPPDLLQQLRQRLAETAEGAGLRYPGILLALLLGRADAVPDRVWSVLRDTGTVHLMVVSGLHVALAAGAGWALGGVLARVLPLLLLRLDARRCGCLTGGLAALLYAAVAGAGLPAQRALLMAFLALLLLAASRTRSVAAVFLFTLTAILVAEPLAVHLQGFWLSFAAVGLLTLGFVHTRASRWRALAAAQLTLSVGLLPLVALLTGSLPWTGFAANAAAVPAVTLAAVPLILLGGAAALLHAPLGSWIWGLSDAVVGAVMDWLELLQGLPPAVAAGGMGGLLVAQFAALWWLLGARPAPFGLLLLCAALPLAPRSAGVAHGEFRVLALDVGQGTAVLVDTHRHRLLYDAGPAFASGFDTGQAVVVPALLATGPPRLDLLVLSHDDLDHTGGAAAVTAALGPRRTLRGAGGRWSCHGRGWTWDAVRFDLLLVPRAGGSGDNDDSCILRVDDGRRVLLIAGDVSRRIEAPLVRALAASGRRVDLLFAPHHGSITSSSRALVRVARPRLVFVSAGRGNRFGHPHQQVLARYREVGARVLVTGRHGALQWFSRRPGEVTRWRLDRAPYWRAGAASSR